jgi:hypothetical protein
LRYRELSYLIGQTIIIHSVDSIEADLQPMLSTVSATGCKLAPTSNKSHSRERFFRTALAKYDLLDLEFIAPQTLLDTSFKGGIKLLEALNLIHRHRKDEPPLDEFAAEERIEDLNAVLTELNEDILQDSTILKVFLESSNHRTKIIRLPLELPDDYFPRQFTVKDACVTNSGFVWISKHFYI